MNIDMQEKWETLHSQPRFRPKYPNENIVQFVFKNFKRDGKTKILDLGCGAGRHVFFMASENIDAYGIDISREGVEYTKKLLQENGLKGTVDVGSIDELPYENDFFHGLISQGVLYYCTINQIEKAVKETYRVLKSRGKGFIVVRTIKDQRYGTGKEIEKNTFIINEEDKGKSSFNENGMTMHFFEKDELMYLFRNFSSINIYEVTITCHNGKTADSNFVVYFEK